MASLVAQPLVGEPETSSNGAILYRGVAGVEQKAT